MAHAKAGVTANTGYRRNPVAPFFFLREVIMKIDVLGTKYNLRRVNYNQDEFMRKMNYGGYCDNNTKEIVILNLRSTPDWAEAQEEIIQRMEKCTIRHELVHAFLNESGLQWNSFAPDKAWAKNEEMVDWFAIQFPKMYEAFRLAGGI